VQVTKVYVTNRTSSQHVAGC